MNVEEVKRYSKVIDMMLTAHSILRDQNQRYALFTDLVLLFSSVILCSVVFVDQSLLYSVNINPQTAQIIIGSCSVIIFFISLIILRVDWKQKATEYGQSGEKLSELKANCRVLLNSTFQIDPESIKALCRECDWTLNNLPKIPENKFLKLKVAHKRKIELSKMIDDHPGTPLFVLRLILCLKTIYFSFFRS